MAQGTREYWPCGMEKNNAFRNAECCRRHGDEKENDIKISQKENKNKLAGTKSLKIQYENKYKYS